MTPKSSLRGFVDTMLETFQGDNAGVVPATGHTAWLTVFASGAMAFLAVFALALSLATGRVADRWADELARTATVRIAAPVGQVDAQTEAALNVLRTTPGISEAHALTDEEQNALLTPWFGSELDLDSLPVPRLIEIVESDPGYDRDGLRLRLAGEVPGAILDDHSRWRAPLVAAANRLRSLGLLVLVLIATTTAVIVTLAAGSALAANQQVISVLRLVGAHDSYIARAFVRRFTLRALAGSAMGTLAGCVAILLMPDPGEVAQNNFLTGLGFVASQWLWPLIVPLLAGAVAFAATRTAAFRALKELT